MKTKCTKTCIKVNFICQNLCTNIKTGENSAIKIYQTEDIKFEKFLAILWLSLLNFFFK